jgi:hypothetical protein
MKGDITRDTFDRTKHFSRVLQQQGRVTVDADANEQSAILLHYLRTLARDLIGPYAAPVENGGFLLSYDEADGFKISAGRYYVDGILVENEAECTYSTQPDYTLAPDDPIAAAIKDAKGQAFWAYLDVWERHITALDDPEIREVALGGPDTATRSKVVWQVKVLPVDIPEKGKKSDQAQEIKKLEQERAQLEQEIQGDFNFDQKQQMQAKIDAINARLDELQKNAGMRCDTPLGQLVKIGKGTLAARVDPGQKIDDPCVTPPDSKYRGAENQLYRVEIHQGGKAGEATFKWSRDNGSVATAWLGTSGEDIQVANTRGFTAGSWVELTDDALDRQGQSGVLVRLAKVEGGALTVGPGDPDDPNSVPASDAIAWSAELVNPRARRWDQTRTEDIVLKTGAVPVTESSPNAEGWIDLEDGIQIRFAPGGEYRSGDYWLIPARVATGKIEWPASEDNPDVAAWSPPMGIEHHYAPLGFMAWADDGWKFKGCRCDFEPLSSCFARGSIAVGSRLLRTGDAIRVAKDVPQAKRTKASRKKPVS